MSHKFTKADVNKHFINKDKVLYKLSYDNKYVNKQYYYYFTQVTNKAYGSHILDDYVWRDIDKLNLAVRKEKLMRIDGKLIKFLYE